MSVFLLMVTEANQKWDQSLILDASVHSSLKGAILEGEEQLSSGKTEYIKWVVDKEGLPTDTTFHMWAIHNDHCVWIVEKDIDNKPYLRTLPPLAVVA